jgi:hypothetical protein
MKVISMSLGCLTYKWKNISDYPTINPDGVTLINVRQKKGELPDFSFKEDLSFKKTKVYFFMVNYNQRSQFDVTLYVPYPVAQEKGISEEKRFLKSQTVYIR